MRGHRRNVYSAISYTIVTPSTKIKDLDAIKFDLEDQHANTSRKKLTAGASFLGKIWYCWRTSGATAVIYYYWCTTDAPRVKCNVVCWRTKWCASSTIVPLAHQWCASRTPLPLEHLVGALGIVYSGIISRFFIRYRYQQFIYIYI
jgi:hypothetical protein